MPKTPKNKKIVDATISDDELEKEFKEALKEIKEQGRATVRVMKNVTVAMMTIMFFLFGLSLTFCGGTIAVMAVIKIMESGFQLIPIVIYAFGAGIGCLLVGAGLEMLSSTM